MMTDLDEHLGVKLRQIEDAGLLRQVYPLRHLGRNRVEVAGRTYLNLSGNDYLGLAHDSGLVEQFYGRIPQDALLEQAGPGAAASRLMTGNTELYEKLEQTLANMYGSESCLVFNSGYHGNTGILPALAGKGDLILSDKLCHASLVDGILLSRARSIRFRHQDYDQLEEILRKHRTAYDRVFIVTESVFSMDGDTVDLHKLVDLKNRYHCSLYVDEAHGVGVFGRNGLGLAEQEGLLSEIDLVFGTFGKALGGVGGFVICSQRVAEYLVNRARTLIYTTGLPPVSLSWILFVLEQLPGLADKRKYLLAQAEKLRSVLRDNGLTTGGSSQIIPVLIGESAKTVALASDLRDQGFWVTAVRPPTVPRGTARLRLSLTATMEEDDLAPLPSLIASALH